MRTESETIEDFINENCFQCKPYNASITEKQCETLRAKTVYNMSMFTHKRKQFETRPDVWGGFELYIQLYLGKTTCKNCDRFNSDIPQTTQARVNGIEKHKTSKFRR